MAQKKESNKKDVKVQDLAPKKDAKGGRFSSNSSANAGANAGANASANRGSQNASANRGSLNANQNLD